MMTHPVLHKLAQQLIVSVQANVDEPLYDPACIVALSQTVVIGGAAGLRLAGAKHIAAVRQALPDIPIIGIHKPDVLPDPPESAVYITAQLADALPLAEAGADIIALDATLRPRPGGEDLGQIVAALREAYPHCLLMADIDSLASAEWALELGFDIVSTTLSGYTAETQAKKIDNETPDLALLATLAKESPVPVILEGRVWQPEHVAQAFAHGAFAVVVGSAITRPHWVTRRFVSALPSAAPSSPAAS